MSLATLSMNLGLARSPTMHWALAVVPAEEAGREVIAPLFDGFNLYIGGFVRELLGELLTNT